MAYTTIDKPTDYFNTVLYTGNGTAIGSGGLAVTGVGFQPDWVWLKNRTTSDRSHQVYDVIRGVTKGLKTNSADAENTSSERLTAFGSDGFTVGNNGDVNTSGNAHVSWNWKAGTSFTNDASSTGIGTLDSTGSSNQTAGFSIVSYTSNGSSSQSVAHNLGGVPEMIISKNRDSGSASYNYWTVYHHSLATANDKKLKLNTSDAVSTTNEWGDTDPTTTVYSLHTSGDGTTNHSTDKIISYCFRSIKGFSKFGKYVGNASTNGSYIHLGFKPSLVMVKKSAGTGSWAIQDNKRTPFNVQKKSLFANLSDAETDSTNDAVDFLSNGFKFRSDTANYNTNGDTYIYMAFAENPFTTSTGIPTTAR